MVKRKNKLVKRNKRSRSRTVYGKRNSVPKPNGIFLNSDSINAFATAYANAYYDSDQELLNRLNEELATYSNKEEVFRAAWNKITNRDASTGVISQTPPSMILSNGPVPQFVGQFSVPGEFQLFY